MKEKLLLPTSAWVRIGIYAALIFAVYHSALRWLVVNDWERDGYSYCYLIPFVVLYLLWYKWSEFRAEPSEPSWAGLAPLLLGLVFYWLGELGGEFLTLYISMWLVIVGLCWLHMGWKKLKTIGFALFFMLTMFPLPAFLNTKIMLQLRLISSRLGVEMIQLYGLPAYREGNIIDLGFTQLQVVDACSGLYSLISLLVLSLLMVYFFRDHLWKRITLIASTVPLAIVTNSLRIAMTAILFKYFGAEVAEGFFHTFSGLMIFILCLPILFLELKILSLLPPKTADQQPEKKVEERAAAVEPGSEKTAEEHPASGKEHTVPSDIFRVLRQPVFITAVVLLSFTWAVSGTVDFREKIPVKKSLKEIPVQVGQWKSSGTEEMEQIFLDVLDLSDYVIVDYFTPDGKSVNLYVAYYQSQSKGQSIHSPATCLPGSGWSFDQSGTTRIDGVSGNPGSLEINRAIMQSGSLKQISYYWFAARGRVLNNAYQLKIYNFWDALTQQRTDGALVRLITRVYDGESTADAEKRLAQFIRDFNPVLEDHIPGQQL